MASMDSTPGPTNNERSFYRRLAVCVLVVACMALVRLSSVFSRLPQEQREGDEAAAADAAAHYGGDANTRMSRSSAKKPQRAIIAQQLGAYWEKDLPYFLFRDFVFEHAVDYAFPDALRDANRYSPFRASIEAEEQQQQKRTHKKSSYDRTKASNNKSSATRSVSSGVISHSNINTNTDDGLGTSYAIRILVVQTDPLLVPKITPDDIRTIVARIQPHICVSVSDETGKLERGRQSPPLLDALTASSSCRIVLKQYAWHVDAKKRIFQIGLGPMAGSLPRSYSPKIIAMQNGKQQQQQTTAIASQPSLQSIFTRLEKDALSKAATPAVAVDDSYYRRSDGLLLPASQRTLMWAFAGQVKADREEMARVWSSWKPNFLHLRPTQLQIEVLGEYLRFLSSSSSSSSASSASSQKYQKSDNNNDDDDKVFDARIKKRYRKDEVRVIFTSVFREVRQLLRKEPNASKREEIFHRRASSINPAATAAIFRHAKFVTSARGFVTMDCFRLYEAVLAGAIPVVVGPMTSLVSAFRKMLGWGGRLPRGWIFEESWEAALRKAKRLAEGDPVKLDAMQLQAVRSWTSMIDAVQKVTRSALTEQSDGGCRKT